MLIYKKKDGKKNIYVDKNNKLITDSEILEYIEKLKIPPAYTDVVIYYEKTPKILFTGIDSKGRKQYIYSEKWCKIRSKNKFAAVLSFAKKIPKIMSDVEKNMKLKKFSINKVMSMIVKLVLSCYFRIGNQKYEKLYGSYGVITMKIKHLTLAKDYIDISFIGKKGVKNDCRITDKILIEEIGKLIAGKSDNENVFQYYDGKWNNIKAIEVNKWLKQYGDDITTKAFRTYDANIFLITKLRELGKPKDTPSKRKKDVNKIIKEISEIVHNTLAICRKEYIHPDILKMYIESPQKFKKLFAGKLSPRESFIKLLS